ncbi:MAG: hypothetical protein EHM93_05355 [Bacteroidales bacterium]|nr:MAG: hypothetical protein EHM93_05355 [Bacteroidales bacterium]
MKVKTSLVLFLSIIWGIDLYAQLHLTSVDFDRVPQKKVQGLLKQQFEGGVNYFIELKPSCYNVQDSSRYSHQNSSHIIKETILKVWVKLKSIRPKDEYRGRMVSFGFLYSKNKDKIFYDNDDIKGIEEGEVLYLNLKLLGGIKNIAVALEVTKVDEENKIIRFCYLNNGMTEGTQQVRLIEDKDGNTVISQESKYRNKSKFREKRLYPIFHRQAVNELHANIQKFIEGF